MNITDWMIAWSNIAISITAIIASIYGVLELMGIKNQLITSTLTNVLSMESEMNDRKEKVDEITFKIQENQSVIDKDTNLKQLYKAQLDSAIENWLNSVDRLCYCIKNNYLTEKDWKAEYRDYIVEIVKKHENKFGESSRYTNIKDINTKWLRS